MQAVGDAFIWIPNAVGFLLGSLQLLLCLVYPRTPRYSKALPRCRCLCQQPPPSSALRAACAAAACRLCLC